MLSKVIFERLYHASSAFVLTGSGISSESGLPTFRGQEGVWKKHKPKDLANILNFKNNSETIWDWYRHRQELIKKAKPNLGHYALVDLESKLEDFTIVTQNIDGLHHLAGNKKIIEAHGNIFNARCTKCDHKEINYIPETNSPKCLKCGNLLRPDVVMVGEEMDKKVLSLAQQAASVCEIFFSVGTSGISHPSSALPFISKANGSYLVEINIMKTVLSDKFNERVEGKASEWLPKITIIYDQISGKR